MYESIGYETYSESKAFKMVRKVNFLPQGLLKRFRTLWLRGLSCRELAKANSKSPLDSLDRNSGEGAALFEIYCISCHGAAGDGMGVLVMRKFLVFQVIRTELSLKVAFFTLLPTVSIQWVLTLIKWMLMSDG
jgi:hypothetical protein